MDTSSHRTLNLIQRILCIICKVEGTCTNSLPYTQRQFRAKTLERPRCHTQAMFGNLHDMGCLWNSLGFKQQTRSCVRTPSKMFQEISS